ncbi:MAG: Rrf2 family transcriptional regulator [Fibrobacteraceae bacterium]|nr:Rrf2 family transcriptional regulator [Fibrobacteraceae bacterium]
MKISTKGRYGIRFLIDVAEQGAGALCTLSDIAKRESISEAYLEQVAVVLKRSGYIRSVKGSSGGFILAKDPSEVRIGEVLRNLEGDLSVVEAPLPGKKESLFRQAIRVGFYNKLDNAVNESLGSFTLGSLICGEKSKTEYMYYI